MITHYFHSFLDCDNNYGWDYNCNGDVDVDSDIILIPKHIL